MDKQYTFADLVVKNKGLLRGPFGGALKKEIFVPKSSSTYKVYEQGPVLNHDWRIGRYYITEDYFQDKMKGFECLPGDFLVSCSGVNYGAIYRLPNGCERGIINQALLRIRVDEEVVDPLYFYYLFQVLISKIITTSGGDSTIPNFPSIDTIKRIPVFLPDLPEQKRIGLFLSHIDDAIAQNESLQNEIHQYVEELFMRWFVQFDFPAPSGKGYKNEGGKLTLNSSLGVPIPSGWEAHPVCKIPFTKPVKAGLEVFKGEKVYLSTSCVEGRKIVDEETLCSYDNRESRADMQPKKNSVWFAKMKNTIKTLSFSDQSCLLSRYVLSTGFQGIECEEFAFPFYKTLIETSWFEASKDYKASGSTQEAVSDETLSYIMVAVPPKEVLESFSKTVHPLLRKQEIAFEQNLLLQRYLKFVMTRLIDGAIHLNS
ncbi:MAG: restriction endonuclease subunit S [Bacilli bacterium]|nr:restriction endonuclease subunit S [Bacilli bacterium]